MNNFELLYKKLILNTIEIGSYNPNRTGVNTYSSFGQTLTHNINDSFPIITGKKILVKNFVHELIWLLNGETNIKYLKDNNVNIWDSWASEDGELGPTYGYQLRSFNGQLDQLNELIYNLKNDKYSRRHIITLWNPLQTKDMTLPPCYFSFQFYVNSKDELSLNVFMRSCDLFIGLPYDFAALSLFLIVIASEVNLKPSVIQFNITDAHIYENQLPQIIKYLNSPIYDLPKITYIGNLKTINANDFTLINYQHGNFLKTPISI